MKPRLAGTESVGYNLPETNLEMQLSEHFRLVEFVRSATAIRLRIDNTPSQVVIDRLKALCVNVLEPLRRRFGVIRITSGYRCRELNKAVKGAANSQHMRGEAADLHVGSRDTGMKVFNYIKENLAFDQMIFEHRKSDGARWLHVSYCGNERGNRRQAMLMTV